MNICDSVSQEERNKAVDSYTDRLISSGYSLIQVYDIIFSVLTEYERKKLKAAKEKYPLHRPAAATLKISLHKKLTQREIWYRNERKQIWNEKKRNNKIISDSHDAPVPVVRVMFVPYTQPPSTKVEES